MDNKRICHYCVVEFPHEPTEDCVASVEVVSESISDAVAAAVMGRPLKDSSEMVDAESSGRKRAAALLPKEVIENMICEWSMLREAGGGVFPIKGCHNNKATDRHHGPDKNTLNNERHTNLHAICAYCHNRWHAANDPTYDGERPKDATPWIPNGEYQLHNPEGPKMTLKESLVEELKRSEK